MYVELLTLDYMCADQSHSRILLSSQLFPFPSIRHLAYLTILFSKQRLTALVAKPR